jgi:hypothetical protein
MRSGGSMGVVVEVYEMHENECRDDVKERKRAGDGAREEMGL